MILGSDLTSREITDNRIFANRSRQRLDLSTGSQQNMEREGMRAVARVATCSHQLIRQSRLEPRVLKVGLQHCHGPVVLS